MFVHHHKFTTQHSSLSILPKSVTMALGNAANQSSLLKPVGMALIISFSRFSFEYKAVTDPLFPSKITKTAKVEAPSPGIFWYSNLIRVKSSLFLLQSHRHWPLCTPSLRNFPQAHDQHLKEIPTLQAIQECSENHLQMPL